MFTVIGIMLGGMGIGFLLRRQRIGWIQRIVTGLIWLLLFLLGTEVGSNRRIIEGLHTLGAEALTVTLASVAGSCLFAWGLWKTVCHRKKDKV